MRVLISALLLGSVALPMGAAAQQGIHDTVRGQYDRPGDFRCDAYWDGGRTDCGARWRGPYRQPYRGYGYGYGYGRRAAYAPDVRSRRRADWCAWRFRSYDPRSGTYRTYDGRVVFCG